MLFLLGCAAPTSSRAIAIGAPEAWVPALADLLDSPGGWQASVATEAGTGAEVTLTAIDDLDCAECYRVDDDLTIHAGGVLGAQYGVAHALRLHGYDVRHPFGRSATGTFADDGTLGTDQSPEISRRGIHLHTLHPIEGLDAMWSDTTETRANEIVDWLIWNRGNYLQWPGLDDISEDPTRHEEWLAHSRAFVDAAHARGIGVGVGVQLFGTSNLQKAFDLIDDPGSRTEDEASIARRVAEIADVGFDNVNLSFGEFSGEDPDTFIDRVNLASAALPDTEMSAVIHVGNYDDLRVEYQGQEYLYYFLVQFADPRIVPWVHSVMYYNLFDDAGGAYLHDEFDEHRQFLIDRLAAGQPAAYFPETAYWVAFDNPVPIWAPLYVRSRWTDLRGLRDAGVTLDQHVLFSSGWEWGYWQNDVAALSMSWHLPESPDELWAPMLPAEAAQTAIDAMNIQHEYLLVGRLAPYLAGRDLTMDLGDSLGIVAAPDRPTFKEVRAMSAEERAQFTLSVLEPLAAFASELESLPTPSGDRFSAEVADGLAVTIARARYIAALYGAVLADDPSALLVESEAQWQLGREAIDRRHADLHDSRHWVEEYDNPTIYDFGYLYMAETMCYWERERVHARELLLGEEGDDPGCAL